MTGPTTKIYRDGNGDPFTAREYDDGTAISAVTMIGDGAGGILVRNEDQASASGDPGIVLLARQTATPADTAGTDGDYAPLQIKDGRLWVAALNSHGKSIKTVSGSLAADTDLIAAVTSKRIKVIAYSLISTGTNANAAIFKSNGTSGTELWRVILQAPAASSVFGANLAVPAPSWLFATVAGEKLTLDVGNSDTVHYSIAYFDDDAS